MATKMNFDQPFQEQPKPVIAPVKATVATPTPAPAKSGMVVLRDLADSSGKALGYDAATKSVMTPGGNYTTDQLKSMGGVLEGGRWMMNESVANNLLGNNAPAPIQAPAPESSDKNVLMDMLAKWGEGFVTSQTASLEQNRDADIAAIKSTLDQAVLDGKLSVREAEKQFEDQKGALEGKAYQDAEGTALYGEEMGIKNSQQMLGVQASDKSRTNSLINSNIKDRDGKILNIKDRIASLQNKAKIDVDLAESKFRAGVTGVKGEAQMMQADKQYDFLSKDYFTNKDQSFQTGEREASQIYNTGERLSEQNWKSQEATDERFWKSTENRLAEDHSITMQGNEFKHDIAITKQKFQNDLTKMANQFGYDSSLVGQRSAASMAEMEKANQYDIDKAQRDIESEFKRYNDPNSMEFKTYKAQRENELSDTLDANLREGLGAGMVEMIMNKGTDTSFSQADITDMKQTWAKFPEMSNSYQYVFDNANILIDKGKTDKKDIVKYIMDANQQYLPKKEVEEVVARMLKGDEWQTTYDQMLDAYKKGVPTK